MFKPTDFSEKTGRLFMIGVPSTILDDETKRLLDEVKPGSVILFSRNIENKFQVKKLIDDITVYLGYKPLFTIDQEGGIVTRLLEGFTVAPSAMAVSATGNSENAYKIGKILGREMKAIGIDWDLAPVVDINNNPDNPGIGIRSYSDCRETVVDFSSNFIKGLEEEGILSCIKHFPGKGRVAVDAHLDMPELNISVEEMYKTEFYPFINVKAPSWMPSHVWISKIQDKKEPATISEKVLTDLIRKELKYDGVLIADDLTMGGVANYYSPEESVLKAFEAGMDILSVCHDTEMQIRVKKFMENKIKNNKILEKRMEESLERIVNIRNKFSDFPVIPLENINRESDKETVQNISEQAVTKISGNINFPLKKIDNVFSVKLTRLVLVEDKKEGIPEIAKEISDMYETPLYIFDPKENENIISKYTEKAKGKVNVIFTENAHLYEGQKKLAEEIAKVSEELILIALRNPYDAGIEGVKNCYCSYGYTVNQQKAIKKLFEGNIKPYGKLPLEWRKSNA